LDYKFNLNNTNTDDFQNLELLFKNPQVLTEH